MTKSLVLTFVLATPLLISPLAIASETSIPAYVNGVFEGARRQQPQQVEGCEAGQAAGSNSASRTEQCSNRFNTVYLVESGGALYLLTPEGNLEQAYCGLLLRSTISHSVLADEAPRTPIQLRSDGHHFFVKIGNRESEFTAARIR